MGTTKACSPPNSWPPIKSPSRAHAHQPLEEEGVQAAMLSIAKLSMMERTHSAPGGIPFGMLLDLPGMNRPRRRLPVSIPEDRAVAPTIPVDNAEAVDRPIHKVTNPSPASSTNTASAWLLDVAVFPHDQQAVSSAQKEDTALVYNTLLYRYRAPQLSVRTDLLFQPAPNTVLWSYSMKATVNLLMYSVQFCSTDHA